MREGEGPSCLARPVHRPCLWCSPVAVGRAEQRERGRRTPPRRDLPRQGIALSMRVQWHCPSRQCQAARGGGQGPSPLGLTQLAPRTAWAYVAAL